MNKFIYLTEFDGDVVVLNTDHIVKIDIDVKDARTRIQTTLNEFVFVDESMLKVEAIINKMSK